MKMHCECLKNNGEQCHRKSRWGFQNVIGGTGRARTDWKYGRSVFMCEEHCKKYQEDKKIKLIENGHFQPYNGHEHYGIVLDRFVDWEKSRAGDDHIIEAEIPEFWRERGVPGPFVTQEEIDKLLD